MKNLIYLILKIKESLIEKSRDLFGKMKAKFFFDESYRVYFFSYENFDLENIKYTEIELEDGDTYYSFITTIQRFIIISFF